MGFNSWETPPVGDRQSPEVNREKIEKKTLGLFAKLRDLLYTKTGRLGMFLVALGLGRVVSESGAEQKIKIGERASGVEHVQKLSAEQLGQVVEGTGHGLEDMIKIVPDVEILAGLNPQSIKVTEGQGEQSGAVVIDFAKKGTPESAKETHKLSGEATILEASGTFQYGEKFIKAEMQKKERELLRDNLKRLLAEKFGKYKEWHIDLNTAIDQVSVNGEAFSSPEGGLVNPHKNLELSKKRADVIKELLIEILASDYGIDASKVDVDIEGLGAQGDVLDFANHLESYGYTFKNKKDNDAKRAEVETIIKSINKGKIDEVLEKINAGASEARITKEDLQKVFNADIALKRCFNLVVKIFDKDLILKIAKPQDRLSVSPSRERTSIQGAQEISQADVIINVVIKQYGDERKIYKGPKKEKPVIQLPDKSGEKDHTPLPKPGKEGYTPMPPKPDDEDFSPWPIPPLPDDEDFDTPKPPAPRKRGKSPYIPDWDERADQGLQWAKFKNRLGFFYRSVFNVLKKSLTRDIGQARTGANIRGGKQPHGGTIK